MKLTEKRPAIGDTFLVNNIIDNLLAVVFINTHYLKLHDARMQNVSSSSLVPLDSSVDYRVTTSLQ